MRYSLSEIRQSFGFSQEELAEKMGKDVSTISRWEREKTKPPVLAPLMPTMSRPYQYISSMIDPELLNHVENHVDRVSICYGSDFMVIIHSKGNLRRYPFLRATYGFSGANYFKREGKRLYNENMDNLNRALKTPGSVAICHTPAQSAIIAPEAHRLELHFLGQNLIKVITREMSSEEASEHPVGTIEYTFE